MRILFFLLFLTATILAQQVGAFGTVSGHVYCSDTQQPARLGRIKLSSIPVPPAAGQAAKKEPSEPRIVSADIGLDGSFLFPNVPPGNYYVAVDRLGYIAPEAQFSDADLKSFAPEMHELIAKSVPAVSVVANKASIIDVHLHRGSSISGTLRYDDGSPVPSVGIDLLRRDKTGQWVSWEAADPPPTDDLGHFRISGLPPGEYMLKSAFVTRDHGGFFNFSTSDKLLNIYYGDVFIQKDAKPIKIGEGEESSGDNITIPISKLHSISGSLLNASGHLISTGEVTLYTMPDNIEIAYAQVESEGFAFHLDFVPEGHYVLRVTNARDVTRETIQPPPGSSEEPKDVETTIQEYGPYEAPFEVVSNMTAVSLTIPPKAK